MSITEQDTFDAPRPRMLLIADWEEPETESELDLEAGFAKTMGIAEDVRPMVEGKYDLKMRLVANKAGSDVLRILNGDFEDGPYVWVGPTAFAYPDRVVVNWEGQEYLKPCGELVTGGGSVGAASFCVKVEGHPVEVHEDNAGNQRAEADNPFQSNLVDHARREMHKAGIEKEEMDTILQMVTVFAKIRPSGAQAYFMMDILDRVLHQRNLTPLTDDPEEWEHRGNVWQNRRNSEAMSYDRGVTYYLLSETEGKEPEEYVFYASDPHTPS